MYVPCSELARKETVRLLLCLDVGSWRLSLAGHSGSGGIAFHVPIGLAKRFIFLNLVDSQIREGVIFRLMNDLPESDARAQGF
jgi:hypothetical protein